MASEAKIALVTGSSSGIGAATVKLLSKKGYKIVVVGSNEERVHRVAKECHELSPHKYEPLALVLDFNNPENGEVAVDKTIEHFGQLDVLVNNAGIFTKSATGRSSYELYRQVMAINLDATVRATLAAAEHLKKTEGNLIFISSVASVKATEKGFAYCMSKSAMSMLARCMAIELAPHVRVNTISPGVVQTPIFGRIGMTAHHVESLMGSTSLLGRVGRVEEIAESIAFLISDQATFVTGHEMFVDGGYLLKSSPNAVAEKVKALKAAKAVPDHES